MCVDGLAANKLLFADVLPNFLRDRWLDMLKNAESVYVITHLLEFTSSRYRRYYLEVSPQDNCELAGLGTDDGCSPRLFVLQSQLAEATTRVQS